MAAILLAGILTVPVSQVKNRKSPYLLQKDTKAEREISLAAIIFFSWGGGWAS
jgi:hypothetical protein